MNKKTLVISIVLMLLLVTVSTLPSIGMKLTVKNQIKKDIDEPPIIEKSNTFSSRKKLAVLVGGGDGLSVEEDVQDSWDCEFEVEVLDLYTNLFYFGPYKSSDIFCLTAQVDEYRDSIYIGEDWLTTKDNVYYAFNTWLKEKSDENTDVFIYINGPSDPVVGMISVHPTRPEALLEVLTPWELDGWLDDIDYHTCAILIDSLWAAGNFIPFLSDENRIIMTSSGGPYNYRLCVSRKSYFRNAFISGMYQGESYGSYADAWMAGDKEIDGVDDILLKPPNPLIDDNGDGLAFGTGAVDILPHGTEGQLASKTYPLWEKTPPTVKLIKPVEKMFYLFNNEGKPCPITVIFGSIDLIVEAYDEGSGVEYVDFYMNEKPVGRDTSGYNNLYSLRFSKHGFFSKLDVKAVDYDGNSNTVSLKILCFGL